MYMNSNTLTKYNDLHQVDCKIALKEAFEQVMKRIEFYNCKNKIISNNSIYNSFYSYNTIVSEQLSDSAINYLILNREMTKNNFLQAKASLNSIKKLEYDWNENGAEPFSDSLIKKCYQILDSLSDEPFIAPTACGAIQFEYEKNNGEYLEFEVYEDKINTLRIFENGEEQSFLLLGNNQKLHMKNMVDKFYGRI